MQAGLPRGAVSAVRLSSSGAGAHRHPRRRLRRPGARDGAVRGARRRGRRHADRPERRVRVRLLEAGRDVRPVGARRRSPSLRRVRQAGRPPAARDDHRDRPRGAPGDDRRRPSTRPTSSSSPSAPTTTSTRPPACSRAATSSTPSRGAERLRDVLPTFTRGRAIVGVCGAPFKCPPAPSEAVLLLHDYLSERGVRDDCEISLVMPFETPVPPSPDASAALLEAFAERGIEFVAGPPGELARPGAQGRRARRRHRAAVRPVPRRAEAPCAGRRPRERDGRGRLHPRRLRTRSRRGSRTCTPSATSRPSACRRRACSRRARRASSPQSLVARLRGGDAARRRTTGAAPATSSSERAASAASTSTSSRGRSRPARSQAPSGDLVADKHHFGSSRRARWFDLQA